MRILVLGAQGMLGGDLMEIFADKHPIGFSKDELDITNKKQVKEKLNKLAPDIVINAAAYTDVDGAESNKESAMKVNGWAVGDLSRICAKLGAIFFHYSTDYVFSGKRRREYKENDIPDGPVNVYGLSKLLGEQNILNFKSQILNLKFYIIRTSWLFGPGVNPGRHKNFVNTILNLARARDEIKVVDDQYGRPTYTFDLARATREIIKGNKPFGIYHVTNEEECSWYEFAKEIVGSKGFKTKIIPCQSKEFPRPAKRPKYSILINTKLPPMRSWREALKDYLTMN